MKPPERIRLLLDQGFPKPPGFEPSSVDRNLEWRHLYDWKRELSEQSTPDWVLYCEAAFGGFNALVTRDFTQSEQAEEMVALSHLHDFHVIAWRQRMDDPISEWGQLLAYLPAIRRHLGEPDCRVIRLPVPTLASDRNVHRPREFIAHIAQTRGQSVRQIRRDAFDSMRDWEDVVARRGGHFTDRLRGTRSAG